jgi:cob(I)alamin adenosyltransferase
MSATPVHRGDDGTTGLLGGDRLPKSHPRIEALGTLDEASAALGMARALSQAPQTGPLLIEVQRDLYGMMAEVAATPENAGRFRTLTQPRLEWLDIQAATIASLAPAMQEFILPGASVPGAALSQARTVVRRAERRLAALLERGEITNHLLLQYLNRLSTLCFALELLENQQAGHPTPLAKK